MARPVHGDCNHRAGKPQFPVGRSSGEFRARHSLCDCDHAPRSRWASAVFVIRRRRRRDSRVCLARSSDRLFWPPFGFWVNWEEFADSAKGADNAGSTCRIPTRRRIGTNCQVVVESVTDKLRDKTTDCSVVVGDRCHAQIIEGSLAGDAYRVLATDGAVRLDGDRTRSSVSNSNARPLICRPDGDCV